MSVSLVSSHFSRLGLGASCEWMSSCVSWHVSSSLYSSSTIASKCEQQWLATDLLVDGVQSPEALRSLDSVPLDALKYQEEVSLALMVLESPLDTGSSAYSQLQKLASKDTTNAQVSADADAQRVYMASWEPKPKRMLKLKVTNGRREIWALDLDGVCSNRILKPGAKVLVKGRVSFRRGHLLLKSVNTKVLGGEVETLVPQDYEMKSLQQTLHNRTNRLDTRSLLPTQSFKPIGKAITFRQKRPQQGRHHVQRGTHGDVRVSNGSIIGDSSDTLKDVDDDDAFLASLVDHGTEDVLPALDEDDALLASIEMPINEDGDCFNDSNDNLFSQIDLTSLQEQGSNKRRRQTNL